MFILVYYCLVSLPLIDLYIHETKFQVRLYNSDRVDGRNWPYHDCLIYDGAYPYPQYALAKTIVNRPYQLIPYCIRTHNADDYFEISGTPVTFQTLMNENITSETLYLSSVPIDIVEQYQAFLEDPTEALSEKKLYNCSISWFGEYCQYTYNSTEPFEEIVRNYLRSLQSVMNNEVWDPTDFTTCYTFIQCDQGPWPSCLDWREVCDGKIDCLNGGIDEMGCDDFDTNECKKDEYRCSNGFCIPIDFFNDDTHNPDCMDGSDERRDYAGHKYWDKCYQDPTFRCEETSCRDPRQPVCGDGQCAILRCENRRNIYISHAKLSRNANPDLSFDCWMSLICLTFRSWEYQPVLNLTMKCPDFEESKSIGIARCPEQFFFPTEPVALGHVRFLYKRKYTFQIESPFDNPVPYYVCYDQELCESLEPKIRWNDSHCVLFEEIHNDGPSSLWLSMEKATREFFARCLLRKNIHTECPKSKPYRCANSSKCLSLNRLMDGLVDCIEADDEHMADSCLLPDQRFRFKCLSDDECVDITSFGYGDFTCKLNSEWTDERFISRHFRGMIYPPSFATVCNGFIDHMVNIALNYTDETNCEQWSCNNVYTRCDEQGIWNCLNGSDEADCPGNPCRPNGHPCISLHDNHSTCLPLSRFNDGIIDCLGAYDERAHCRTSKRQAMQAYQCFNDTTCLSLDNVCVFQTSCPSLIDYSGWCHNLYQAPTRTLISPNTYFCNELDMPLTIESWDLRHYVCKLMSETLERKPTQFTVKSHSIYPIQNTIKNIREDISKNRFDSNSIEQWVYRPPDMYCKRGVLVYANSPEKRYCLCPPAYFGDRCEYQNQRVSLTMQFRTTEWSTLFNLIILLVDNFTTIQSFEQLEYLAIRDCRKKFNVNLLYSNRPKLADRTYHVRIDIYDKMEGKHISSLIYPVEFPFLPVYRLSQQVYIFRSDSSVEKKNCPLKCVHGRCIRYGNQSQFFCLCSDGYSGNLCSIKTECNCSPDSICVGTVNNRSICVCPLNKFGPRCYLKRTVCYPNPCMNNNPCFPTDVRISESEYFCVCRKGFTGSKCELTDNKIEFSFAKGISIPQSALIHFIDATPQQTAPRFQHADPIQTTLILKIRFDQISSTIFHNGLFHVIFLQIDQNYYLALLQHNHTSGVAISTKIIPQNRCPLTSHFLESYIRNYPTWHRVTYYQSICQKHVHLQCFHDNDRFMCLCDTERFANCFKFDFKRVYNCFGNNACENNGRCYQNHNTCPTVSSCFCDECYYGTRCQFTSTGFGLSIDTILGYSILPRASFSRQPFIIHLSTALTLLMFVLSIINGTLSIITFRTKKSLAVGCGVYLLSLSVASCLTMLLFTVKFIVLIFSHISTSMNKNFLIFNCIIMDILLKSFLAIVDWLYACVAIERVWMIYRGTNFDRKRSVILARRMIYVICVLTLVSYTHDPTHRHLLEDSEEQRNWCIVRYTTSMKALSSTVNIVHFLIPLSINLIAVAAIIILLTQQKSKTVDRNSQEKHLWTQVKKHKHYLVSSIVLIIVATPRLVISFRTECMTTVQHSWPYLTAYFSSFVSPLLVFIFFGLHSEFYRKQFFEQTLRFRRNIQRRFRD